MRGMDVKNKNSKREIEDNQEYMQEGKGQRKRYM